MATGLVKLGFRESAVQRSADGDTGFASRHCIIRRIADRNGLWAAPDAPAPMISASTISFIARFLDLRWLSHRAGSRQ